MKDFSNYLEKNNKVDPRQVPNYLGWVSKFLKFCETQSGMENPETRMERFLVQLGKKCQKRRYVSRVENKNRVSRKAAKALRKAKAGNVLSRRKA